MKVQMKFQKILTLVSLIVAALSFVFAITYLSGGLNTIQYYRPYNVGIRFGGVEDFYKTNQAFVSTLVVLSIIFIVSALLLMITSTNTRRKYYITNYIAIGLFVLVGVVVALYMLIYLFIIIGQYNGLDWESLNRFYETDGALSTYPEPVKDFTTIILGLVLSVVILADIVVWALNFVWKLKLMKGEKALLEQGLVKEVA